MPIELAEDPVFDQEEFLASYHERLLLVLNRLMNPIFMRDLRVQETMYKVLPTSVVPITEDHGWAVCCNGANVLRNFPILLDKLPRSTLREISDDLHSMSVYLGLNWL